MYERDAKQRAEEAEKKQDQAEQAAMNAADAIDKAGVLLANATIDDEVEAAKDHVEERVQNLHN